MHLKDVPIDVRRMLRQDIFAAIGDLIDAIVEFVTNSDDAYKRIRREKGGDITIELGVTKAGKLQWVQVDDDAGGMTEEELQNAMGYAYGSSGHAKHRGIRGVFGRGLKQAILFFGEGEIVTKTKNGPLLSTRLFPDGGHPKYDSDFRSQPKFVRVKRKGNWCGTTVLAKVSSKAASPIPPIEELCSRIACHYALRDIVRRRRVFLSVNSRKQKKIRQKKIRPHVLDGKKVLEQSEDLPQIGPVQLVIYEAGRQLEGNPSEPWCLYGFTITTEAVPVDHRVFLEGHSACKYFFGTIEIPGIAESLRKEDFSLLKPDRSGLAWNKGIGRKIEQKIKEWLRQVFDEKAREGSSEFQTVPKEERWLKFLNQGFAKWFGKPSGEFPSDKDGRGGGRPQNVTKLTIVPDFAYVPAGSKRSFSIYAPTEPNSTVIIRVRCDPRRSARVNPDDILIVSRDEDMATGTFEAYVEKSCMVGERILLIATMNGQEAEALIEVEEEREKSRGKDPKVRPGKIFTGIKFDNSDRNPVVRVRWDRDTGEIVIYKRFPCVGSVLQNLKTKEAKVLLAELITEAVCRASLVIDYNARKLSQNLSPPEIAMEIDERRRKCVEDIYQFAKAYRP
jgi:hypothetical protein